MTTDQEFQSYIGDLLSHQDVQRLHQTKAHWHRDRFEHCYAVGLVSFRLAKLVHGNRTVAARGGFLHDWYHGHQPERVRFKNPDGHHFRQSHAAAATYGESPEVLHAIRTHMWPWGRTVPRTREAWVVWAADNLVWLQDIWHGLGYSIRTGWHNFLYGPQL